MVSDGGNEIFPHLHPQLFLVCGFIIGGVCKQSLQQISKNHDCAIYSRDPSLLVSLKRGNNRQWIYKKQHLLYIKYCDSDLHVDLAATALNIKSVSSTL